MPNRCSDVVKEAENIFRVMTESEVVKTEVMQQVCESFQDFQFYFNMMKDSFVSKYQNTSNDENSAGVGQSFPDHERTQQLDIRALLLSQPKNVLSELQFHKDLFSKLKFNYIESESQHKFLKRVLEIPALFVGEEQVSLLQLKISGQKEKLKVKKKEIHDKKTVLTELIENVVQKFDDTVQKKKTVLELSMRINRIEKELMSVEGNHEEISIQQLEETSQRVNLNSIKIQELQKEIEKWKDVVQNKVESNAVEDGKLQELKKRKGIVESQAAEAVRAAKYKNPQFEELCKWYTEINSLLYKTTGISQIRNLSETEFEIDYEDEEAHVVATLFLKIDPDADAHFKRLVNAKVKGLHCPIQDIVIHGNLTITKLDELLSFIVSCSKTRIYENLNLSKEIQQISVKFPGLVWDPETRQLLIHAESSGRAFVISIKQGYPSLGWQSFEFIGIEPSQGDAEIELWQDKIAQSQVKSLLDLIRLLD